MVAATRFSVPDSSSDRLIALCAMNVSDGPVRMAFFQMKHLLRTLQPLQKQTGFFVCVAHRNQT
jgi:hypothetical protein